MYVSVKIDPSKPLSATVIPAVEALLVGSDFYLDEDRWITIRGEEGMLYVETVEK